MFSFIRIFADKLNSHGAGHPYESINKKSETNIVITENLKNFLKDCLCMCVLSSWSQLAGLYQNRDLSVGATIYPFRQ